MDTLLSCRERKQAMPPSAWRKLMILHSYILVKWLVKIGNHEQSALCLLRVAGQIDELKNLNLFLESFITDINRIQIIIICFVSKEISKSIFFFRNSKLYHL